jgi:hypothetical protein
MDWIGRTDECRGQTPTQPPFHPSFKALALYVRPQDAFRKALYPTLRAQMSAVKVVDTVARFVSWL